jgi:hypothetical protein
MSTVRPITKKSSSHIGGINNLYYSKVELRGKFLPSNNPLGRGLSTKQIVLPKYLLEIITILNTSIKLLMSAESSL